MSATVHVQTSDGVRIHAALTFGFLPRIGDTIAIPHARVGHPRGDWVTVRGTVEEIRHTLTPSGERPDGSHTQGAQSITIVLDAHAVIEDCA